MKTQSLVRNFSAFNNLVTRLLSSRYEEIDFSNARVLVPADTSKFAGVIFLIRKHYKQIQTVYTDVQIEQMIQTGELWGLYYVKSPATVGFGRWSEKYDGPDEFKNSLWYPLNSEDYRPRE